ncbi:hypothetical protein BDV95DRAFT_505159 [Massariosphaeria phaeospora]|uniref:Integral membrane protein n=1 Tax=Massariosphaeria phaeospora TaxID=100035 RepID=A0A7C8I109_9PLEO|nr:hypothetical protein BDV95DRAFT_505159 [Massariosphaeria phaeospora]
MDKEFQLDENFTPWGPFVPATFRNEPITLSDIIIASIVWILTVVNVFIAIWLGYRQTRASRSPLRSVYVWLIWLELLASFSMGLECILHLLKIIRPSFAFYVTILFWWCIQVQLLLQIIINRIRVIVPDRRRSKHIMIGTAAMVTVINISVFTIWIPARLQISNSYKLVNDIWDRVEKVLYLIIDAALNWYFLKVVKANLINNGLQKYNKLLRFNQRIIVLSLLMDVMIIAAMSIPNSFVYIQFHPLAYLVKLNIEMTMANLIKRIAISTSHRTGNIAVIQEFVSSNLSSSGATNSASRPVHRRRSSLVELSTFALSSKGRKAHSRLDEREKIVSFAPTGKQIKKTEEITVSSEPNPEFGDLGYLGDGAKQVEVKSKSLDDVTEGGESVKSVGVERTESDDEVRLVGQRKKGWDRLKG